jgi:glycosyltransferase involved in cell wall biosynthesis
MQISVVICTHNPRPDYLRRVLDAFKVQTLPKEQWELLLIDNASKEPLAAKWDLSWHPHARHIRENELGLTPARLRGIKESTGKLLIFVDDDNILAENYLSEAIAISSLHPSIMAFGGSIKGEFQIPPPPWIKPYLPGLVISELDRDYWANFGNGLTSATLATPYGAGLVIARSVAENFFQNVSTDRLRKSLDRSGQSLFSGGDTDMALCSIDLGFGMGRFYKLKLTHIIPSTRLTQEYIIKLYSGFNISAIILAHLRPEPITSKSARWKIWLKYFHLYIKSTSIQKRVMLGSWRARKTALDLISKYGQRP